MAKRRIVQDKDGKKVEIDQDKIDAALAGAVMNPDGRFPRNPPPAPQPEDEPETDDWAGFGSDAPDPAPAEEQVECPAENETSPIAMSVEEFGKKCFHLDINATMCHYQSSKTEDKTITEYIRGINKKIYEETKVGGFSTNVQFRVAPNDWVNVNHIIDWYKSRGFAILNFSQTSSPYGKEAGLMEYNFTISWADSQ